LIHKHRDEKMSKLKPTFQAEVTYIAYAIDCETRFYILTSKHFALNNFTLVEIQVLPKKDVILSQWQTHKLCFHITMFSHMIYHLNI